MRPHRQPADRPDASPTGVGYGPASLISAYSLPSFPAGDSQTVAVVDAYDDPNIAADLATYRSAWGLPACGAGCFSEVNQDGASSPLPSPAPAGSNWAVEESLDVDMVSAICPVCRILLVEANSNSLTDLGTGVNAAVSLGARYVSNSYGGPESSLDTGYDSSYFNHPGVVVTAAAGDNGFGVSYPAASQYVTSVGGTTLTAASNSRGFAETAWSGTGSGCSAYDPKPSWQTDTGCSARTDNDVAAVADPNTGVAIYDTYAGEGGWLAVGGTSAATPIIASIYALAGSPLPGSYPASYPYGHPSGLFDITSGSDGSCGPAYLCTAEAGYDGPTGEGTPDGTSAFTSPPQFQAAQPAVGENADGRLETFASATNGAMWRASQYSPGGSWTGWYQLGGISLAAVPAAGVNSDGRLETFDVASDGHIYHAWQETPGGTWTGWVSLGAPGGGLATSAAVARNSDGRLEIFATAPSGTVWHNWQTTPGGSWNGWVSLGAPTSLAEAPSVGVNSDGRLEVFQRGLDGHMYHASQNTPGGSWSGWSTLGAPGGGLATRAAVARNSDGRLEIFATAPSGTVWHNWQTSPGGTWSGWVSLGAPTSLAEAPSVGVNSDGRLEVFQRGSDGHMYHAWQTTPGGAWTGWSSLGAPGGGLAAPAAVARNSDGRLEIFVTAPGGKIWHAWQNTPGGTWTGWSSLG